MDASRPASMPAALASRPRLTPGVPAGGIAAALVLLGVVVWGVSAGSDHKDDSFSFKIKLGDEFKGMVTPPRPPAPPAAPAAPMPPMPPVSVDGDAISRAVEQALSNLDGAEDAQSLDSAREGLARAQEGLAAASMVAPQAVQEALHRAQERLAEAQQRLETRAAARADAAIPADEPYQGTLAAPDGVELVNFHGDVSVEASSSADKVSFNIDNGAGLVRTELREGRLFILGTGEGAAHSDVHLIVPADAALSFKGLVGDLNISGRSGGRLAVEMRRGDISAERLGGADITILETGSVSISRVDGPFRAQVQGSSDISVERAETASLVVMGHATVNIERVNDRTDIRVPGYGEIAIGRANGPMRVEFPGAGSVSVADGRAEPLQAIISGAGSLDFEGIAQDPNITLTGSGSVRLARYEGKPVIRNTGSGRVQLGNE